MSFNNIVNRIRIRKKEGKLFFSIIKYLKRKLFLFFIPNRNLITKLEQIKTYKYIEKRYEKIIKEDIIPNKIIKNNIIWVCWFQGIKNAPELVQICYHSLLKNLSIEYKIILLTEENMKKYVQFPEYIEEKRKNGRISNAHYSDLIRLELLTKYGGIWIDATVFVSDNKLPSFIKNSELFIYKKYSDISTEEPIIASNWLISVQKESKILSLTKKILYQYWNDNNFTIDYFIFHIIFSIAAKRYPEEWIKIPTYSNTSPHIMVEELDYKYNDIRWKQLLSISFFHKLSHHKKHIDNINTFYSHIKSIYLRGKINGN